MIEYNETLQKYLDKKFAEMTQELSKTIEFANKNVFNVKELARFTGLSVGYVYNLVSGHKIPHYKTDGGKLTFFKKSEIEDWLCSQKMPSYAELLTENKLKK